METVLKNRFNCYNLSTIGNQSIIDWTNSSGEVIDVIAYPCIYLNYKQYNSSNYQWCGPMLYIVEFFARLTGTRIKILPTVSWNELRSMLSTNIQSNELGHIVLNTIHAKIHGYFRMEAEKDEINDFNDYISISSPLMYYHLDSVLASTIKERQNILSIFEDFDTQFYLLVLPFITMLIMFSVSLLSQHSIQKFWTTFWYYLSIVLGDNSPRSVSNTVDRLLTGGWLMAYTILSIIFSVMLRNMMTKPQTIFWVDSWNDLSLEEWKHMKIVTTSTSSLAYNMKTFGSDPLAHGFRDKVTVGIDFDRYEKGERSWDNDIDYDQIKNGKMALIENLDQLTILKKNLVTKFGLNEDVDFHISKSLDIPSQAAFIVYNKMKMNESITRKLNLVIDILRESGIFGRLQEKTLNPEMIYMNSESSKYQDEYEYDNLNLSHYDGPFILYLIATLTTIFILIAEMLVFFINFFKINL